MDISISRISESCAYVRMNVVLTTSSRDSPANNEYVMPPSQADSKKKNDKVYIKKRLEKTKNKQY